MDDVFIRNTTRKIWDEENELLTYYHITQRWRKWNTKIATPNSKSFFEIVLTKQTYWFKGNKVEFLVCRIIINFTREKHALFFLVCHSLFPLYLLLSAAFCCQCCCCCLLLISMYVCVNWRKCMQKPHYVTCNSCW